METSAYRLIRQALLGKKFEYRGKVYHLASQNALTKEHIVFTEESPSCQRHHFNPEQLCDLTLIEKNSPLEDSTVSQPSPPQTSGVFIDTEGKRIHYSSPKERRALEAMEREYRQRRAIMDEQGD